MRNMVAVFMENKSGKLAKITEVLAKNNIDIILIDIEDRQQFGLCRILTADPIKARDVLYDANFTVALEKTVVVEIDDKVGSMAHLAKIMDEEGINVNEASGSIIEKGKKAIFSFKTDNPEKLEAVLVERGIKVLDL